MAKRIGILTGGGDVPGLNPVIKSVVYSATAQAGFEVIGLRKGWQALTHITPDGAADFVVAQGDPDGAAQRGLGSSTALIASVAAG